MIKNIVIFFIMVVCLSVEIEAKICRASTLKIVKVTITYTYSYLVTFYGECYYGNDCLLSRWETRGKNKTIERPDIELKYKCCPGWRDISTNETGPNLVCVPDNSTLEINPTTYNATHNGTILEILRRFTTTTERPEYNDSVPYHRRYTNSTEILNNDTAPSYRGYTTSTERNYNDTVPFRWWTTTSTERPYRRYTTTTDRPYYRTVPSYRWYTTSTERNNNDTVPYRWWTPTSTERSYRRYTTTTDRPYFRTVPSYRRYTTSTERNNNDTVLYRWRYTTSTEEPTVLVGQRSSHLDEIEKTTTKYTWPIPIGSLPDIDEPYRPYNWNNTTYKIKPIDYNIPFTTVPVDTNETGKPMCPKQRWILILTSIILVFTALCVTLLVWRIILLKKYHVRERPVVDQDPKPEIQDMYNATYTSTETKAKINSIYPSTADL